MIVPARSITVPLWEMDLPDHDQATSRRADTPDPRDAEARRLSLGVSRHDPRIAGEFYDAWIDWSVRTAMRLTRRDEQFCLDVVQESMLKAIRAMPVMNYHAEIERWMRRVIQHAAIDALRTEERRLARERKSAGASESGTITRRDLESELAWLREQMSLMESDEAASVRVRFGHEGTLREAAIATTRTVDATHGRLRRLLNMLKGKATEHGHE